MKCLSVVFIFAVVLLNAAKGMPQDIISFRDALNHVLPKGWTAKIEKNFVILSNDVEMKLHKKYAGDPTFSELDLRRHLESYTMKLEIVPLVTQAEYSQLAKHNRQIREQIDALASKLLALGIKKAKGSFNPVDDTEESLVDRFELEAQAISSARSELPDYYFGLISLYRRSGSPNNLGVYEAIEKIAKRYAAE